jgi:hypothetical protein
MSWPKNGLPNGRINILLGKNLNTVLLGDCLDVLRGFPDKCVDSIITDPPYGIRLLGKKWDYQIPTIGMFQGMLRVIKPGGALLCFGSPRTFHRIAVNIEDAGFIITDTIGWLHLQGMPKSLDVSYQIDKRRGTLGPVKSKGVGTGPFGGVKKYAEYGGPGSPEGFLWNGWQTGLKPAWEPIIVAMRPTEGTYDENALEYGVAGLNTEGCRIPCTESTGMVVRGVNGRHPADVIVEEGLEVPGIGQPDRFFFCPKPSKKERGEGNDHVSVKPLDLMRYLVRLTKTPFGGVVLDPFAGSGTTGVAAQIEERDFVLIEKDPEYHKIALGRISK